MEEWEEPLHPGSLPRTYPTFSHNATLFAHLLPLFRPDASQRDEIPANKQLLGIHRDEADGTVQRKEACRSAC